MSDLVKDFRAGVAAFAMSVAASLAMANTANAQEADANSSAGADSSSESEADANASAGADSSSTATGGNANATGGNAHAAGGAGGAGGDGGDGGNASAGADSSSILNGGDTTLNGGDTNVSQGQDTDVDVSQGGINLDTGGNTVLTSVVTYPNTQAVIECDTKNRTLTLNTIIGGVSYGSSRVADMEEIQRCNLSRMIKDVLIPEAQSSDPSISARARMHLDALIPGLNNAEASDAYLERFIEALGAGVDPDAASHPSRAANFVAMLTSNIPFVPGSPIVEYLNEPASEPEVQVTVIRNQPEAMPSAQAVVSATPAPANDGCSTPSVCGDASDAARRAAAAVQDATPQP